MIGLIGRESLDGKSVDRALHHVAQCIVDHAMARQCAVATKTIRNQPHAVMPTTASSPGMTGMQMAFVFDFE